MKETIEYVVEYKVAGSPFYVKTCRGHKDKDMAVRFASKISGKIKSARVVEQKRKVIKVVKESRREKK